MTHEWLFDTCSARAVQGSRRCRGRAPAEGVIEDLRSAEPAENGAAGIGPPDDIRKLPSAAILSVPLWIPAALLILIGNRIYATLDWADQLGQSSALAPAYTVLAVDELGIAAGVVLLAALWPARLRTIGLALLGVYALLYWIDVQILKALWHRLTIPYLHDYVRQPAPVVWLLGPKRIVRNVLLIVLPALLIHRGLRARRWTIARGTHARAAAVCLLGVIAVLPWTNVHCRVPNRTIEYFMRSMVQYNAHVLLRRGTDPAVAARVRSGNPELDAAIRALHTDPPVPPPGPRPNVIVLISESLSRVDSLRSGGLYDRLPRIDRMQADGMTLTNVMCDGEITSDALASVLIGVPPYPTAQWEAEMSKRFPRGASRNLAARAQASSYSTAFLSNAPLELDGDGAWVRGLGFEVVVGGTSPEFAGTPRFVFEMPSDEALYQLAWDHIRAQHAPSLTVLVTVSLHKPYILPDARDDVKNEPLLGLLRYVDRTTFEFYRRLRAANFFDHGVLLLVGDHRRMTPLEPAEERSLGVDAAGRVVASLIGAGIEPGAVSDAFLNQTDLLAVLYDLVDGKKLAPMADYSKASRLGFAAPFAVTVADGESGTFTVRRTGGAARELDFRPDSEPAGFAPDRFDQQVATYVILQVDWLQSVQLAASPLVSTR